MLKNVNRNILPSVRIQADESLMAEAYDMNSNAVLSRATDKYNPYSGVTVGSNARVTRPVTVLGKSFNMDLNSSGSTNLALQTEDFEVSSVWKQNGAVLSNLTDGYGQMVVAGTQGNMYQVFSATSGTSYTFSCRVSTTEPVGFKVRLVIQGNGGSHAFDFMEQSAAVIASDGELYLQATWLADSTETMRAVIFKGTGATGTTTTFTQPQVEALPIPTPYIKTTTVPVTRAADSNVIASFPYAGQNGTMFAAFIPYEHDHVDNGSRGELWRRDSNNSLDLVNGTDDIEGRRDDNISDLIKPIDTSGGLLSNVLYSITQTMNGISGDHILTTQNGTFTANTSNLPFETLISQSMSLGSISGGNNPCNCWYILLYWDRVLSDAEKSEVRNGVVLL